MVYDYFTTKMISNGKTLNYKVVDLVEIYNFRTKLPPSEFKQKNYKFLKTNWTPYRHDHGGSRRYTTARALRGRSLPPPPGTLPAGVPVPATRHGQTSSPVPATRG
jgi:hypothetical protein